MKKTIFAIILVLSLLFVSTISVSAYSPHYLPGGKNYISSDNVRKVGSNISTINPLLVKPYTEYTFSVSRDYTDGADFEVVIYLYNNLNLVDELVYNISSMRHDEVPNHAHFTFLTPANVNYIAFTFNDNGSNYISGEELYDVQLEEGVVGTPFESYIRGAIIDTSAPYFIGGGTVISYFDQPITSEEIKDALTAYDDIDGDLTDNIMILEDNYTDFIGVLGSYTIIFSVSDNSGNTTHTTVNVEVVDILPPVFTEIPEIIAVYPNVFSVEDIIFMLSASDNYDGDISSNITLVRDDYTDNAHKIGTYEFEVSVIDSSGNETYYIQQIKVIDNEGPVIIGTENIQIGYDKVLNPEAIKSSLSVIDNYDDEDDLVLVLESDSYSPNHNRLGTYIMRFSVTDSSGNKSYKTISIEVMDEIGPTVYFNSSVIQVYSDTVLGLPDFAKLLIRSKELEKNQNYFITIRYDSYTRHANKPGTYHMYLDFEDGYGRVISKDFQVKVLDKKYDYIFFYEEQIEDRSNPFRTSLIYMAGGGGLLGVVFTGVVAFKTVKTRIKNQIV